MKSRNPGCLHTYSQSVFPYVTSCQRICLLKTAVVVDRSVYWRASSGSEVSDELMDLADVDTTTGVMSVSVSYRSLIRGCGLYTASGSWGLYFLALRMIY